MKNLLIVAALLSASLTHAWTEEQQEGAEVIKGYVRAFGYVCDTVDAVIPFVFSEGYTIRCNGYRYSYEAENKGGTFIVTVK